MCGVAGFLDSKRNTEDYSKIVLDMLRQIAYRGPDEQGFYFDKNTALGSVRLSIIDKSSGTQPIVDEDQRYVLVYNGELYNYIELRQELLLLGHKFKTQSDTEVLLKSWIEWGEHALLKFDGAYAFVIYDRRNKKTILVRDRFGERPLYYIVHNGTLIFASELKCFLKYPDIQFNWDEEVLESVLTIWTPLPDETVFRDIKQVPSGSFIAFNNGTVDVIQYYDLPFNSNTFKGSEAEAAERVRELMRESVSLRMRSDVEVGTYLSGGLDSSVITQIAAEQSPHSINTFSIAFEEKEYDESSQQEQISKYLGTKHKKLLISNQMIAEEFPKSIWHAETPLFRTALVPLYSLSKSVKKSGLKVVLTGEGSDEIFLGYDIFKETLLRLQWNSLTQFEREYRVSKLYPYLELFNSKNIEALVGLYNRFPLDSDSLFSSHEMRFRNSKFALRLLRSKKSNGLNRLKNYLGQNAILKKLSHLERAQWLESKTLLSGYLLSSQGDRMSMANSVENRCPFLNHKLVDFVNSLPLDMRLKSNIKEKFILQQAFKNLLPKNILFRAKQPYRSPDSKPFISCNRPDYINDLLNPKRLTSIDFIDANFCQGFIKRLNSVEMAEKLSPRENQALIALLSIVLLDSQFIRNENNAFNNNIKLNVVCRMDGRLEKISNVNTN